MKRCFFTMLATLLAFLFGSTLVDAQTFYSNAKPMTYGYGLKIYHNREKTNLFAIANHIPEDKFFLKPPTALAQLRGEEQSLGHLVAEAANTAWRMCTIITTGVRPPVEAQPGNVVLNSANPTKAGMIEALKKAYDVCDPIVYNFDDSKITAMVTSQNALAPLGIVIFNVTSHSRELVGKLLSYMVVLGIPRAPGMSDARDPNNPDNLYYCAGQASKTLDLCR